LDGTVSEVDVATVDDGNRKTRTRERKFRNDQARAEAGEPWDRTVHAPATVNLKRTPEGNSCK
jgi:hypothetical protein